MAKIESWRKVWRDGMAGQFPTQALEALRAALAADDPRLIQGATTTPPPLLCVQDWPTEGCCPIGYLGWHDGQGRTTVGQIEDFFAQACFKTDRALGEPAATRWFINWWDETPRAEAVSALLAEVDRTLAERNKPAEAA